MTYFTDKAAVITGAGSGIGEATVRVRAYLSASSQRLTL